MWMPLQQQKYQKSKKSCARVDLEKAKQALQQVQTQMENAKEELKKTFPREEELEGKSRRLQELDSLLNLDEQELPQINASVYREKNEDYVAYLYIPDTEIEYPVVQRNNSYYLNHNFYGEKNAHGTIFLDENCSTEDPVLLLHGHHMKDGTMFGSLKQYRDKEFRQAHSEIFLDMGEGFDTYEVFAILQIDLTKEDYFAYEEIPKDADSLTAYLKQMQKNATWYEQPGKEDKLLLLSTCAYGSEDERMVVAAYKK